MENTNLKVVKKHMSDLQNSDSHPSTTTLIFLFEKF